MKVNFSTLSFKSDLLIDNRANNPILSENTQKLKNSFKRATEKNNGEFLILISGKDRDEDIFTLFNSSNNKTVEYQSQFSSILDKIPYKKAVKRLCNIYELMKIKASHIAMIEGYKTERAKYIIRINAAIEGSKKHAGQNGPTIPVLEELIKVCEKGIHNEEVSMKAECDSFELTHGLKEELC